MRIKKRIKRFFTQSHHFHQKAVYNDEYLSFRTHGSAQNALTFHLTHIHSPHEHFYVMQPTGHLKQIGILPHLSHSKNAGIHYKKPFSSGVPGLFSLFPISQSDTCH